jgi:hypothetical protein
MQISKPLNLFILIVCLLLVAGLNAQETGNKNVVTQEREVPAFNGVDAGGALDVYIQVGETHSVKIETDENLQEKVTAEVNNDILKIKSKGIKNPTKLNAYITLPELTWLKAGGATTIKGESLFETDEMGIWMEHIDYPIPKKNGKRTEKHRAYILIKYESIVSIAYFPDLPIEKEGEEHKIGFIDTYDNHKI